MANMTRWNGTSGYPILTLNKATDLGAGTAQSASTPFGIELTGGDYKTAIIFSGTSGKKVTFAIGNGIQGVGADLEVTLASANEHIIVLDSGYFKNVSGTDKNMVIITPEAQTTFKVVELPQ